MTQKNCLISCKHDLILILHVQATSLQYLARASKDNLISHTQLLPSTLLPTLCCIISEHFLSTQSPSSGQEEGVGAQSAISATAYAEDSTPTSPVLFHSQLIKLIDSVVSTLAHVRNATIEAGHKPLWFLLKNPAVSQLLRLLVALPATSTHVQLLHESLACLRYIMQKNLDFTVASESDENFALRDPNVSSKGLPQHLNPWRSTSFTKQALKADVRLMHALNKLIEESSGTRTAKAVYDFETELLWCWIVNCELFPPSPSASAIMNRGVIEIATQCTSHG